MSNQSDNEDRIRRANSWFEASRNDNNELENLDEVKFIFLWIAFNAAYGNTDMDNCESKKFGKFLQEIIGRDTNNEIRTILWKKNPITIRRLLDWEKEKLAEPIHRFLKNPFVNKLLYELKRKKDKDWARKLEDSQDATMEKAKAQRDVHGLLKEVFGRLYTLRNQILHGGMTFAKGIGRDKIGDGRRIMADLVPVILKIMENDLKKNPDSTDWGEVPYPRQQ